MMSIQIDDPLVELSSYLAAAQQYPTLLNRHSLDASQALYFEQSRQVFNRRFDLMPLGIVMVENTEQVSLVIKFANTHDIAITVRSGGHDHEGESVATGKLLIDFCKMRNVNIQCGGTNKVDIQPGARFCHIKSVLDNANLSIPHGTCQTVAIAGYAMGGGWGPWTRKYGMACEHLIGATLVLGDGSIEHVSITDAPDLDKGKLLWAIRGGGGLSYGIVTSLTFQAFELPELAFSFTIQSEHWDLFEHIPAIYILQAWEQAIADNNNPGLIGTNLKMDAIGLANGAIPDPHAVLSWQFNGHFGGTEQELAAMIISWINNFQRHLFVNVDPHLNQDNQKIIKKWVNQQMMHIGRVVRHHRKNRQGYQLDFDAWERGFKKHHIRLETDEPAPHKLTSKLAQKSWNDASRQALICSLQSRHLALIETKSNINTYITLGAICGQYYQENPEGGPKGSSFPYKDRLFTVQYQAWWDQIGVDSNGDRVSAQNQNETRFFENRAQDWIEECRYADIPHTYGAFISFKDAAIPTSDYFLENYEKLMAIKLTYSKDDHCLLRSRKTII
ncbi:FAD-binding oxidoreductase [Shewanella surugensis]|uniref:FAD-dependent oxidoreductase n=1 Tax=Shewanella surugensis TaxID=212020 RepID=A0ABT0LGH8_9GAMM|nr:FAD-dependent oxidoreductase [Shewanella surugensis]MCL1126276.1 FAD-dependent oxidoreductase [Shewanella surugensis]